MIRYLILFTLFTVASSTIMAQEWETDFEAAKQKATESNNPIILVFQGSDWCAPCIKLDRDIWSTDTFKAYAEDHFVMLQADFPRKKKNALPEALQKHNNALAERYNPNGIFPFVAVLDSNGKLLGETGYKKISPSEYISLINSIIP